MKVKVQKFAVTKHYLTIGLVFDYNGPLRFATVKIPVEELVDTDLYGYLGVAAMRRADRAYREWEERQDMLFD